MENTQDVLLEAPQNTNQEDLVVEQESIQEQSKPSTKENERSSSLDLFRILSMFLIVLNHTITHGGILDSCPANSLGKHITNFILSVCLIAVNCFALITGYLYADKKIKIKNILSLYFQVISFTIVMSLLTIIFKKEVFSYRVVIKNIFPIASGQYWYFSAYFLLFLAMPLLNVILKNISKKFMLIMLIILIILGGVYICLAQLELNFDFSFSRGYSFIWLAVLYLVGGILKLLNIASKLKTWLWFVLFVLSILLNYVLGTLLNMLGKEGFFLTGNYMFFFNILSAIFLLMGFVNLNLKTNRFISLIAKASFGVYLFHDNVYFRNAIIIDGFTFLSGYNGFIVALGAIGIALGIYIVGTIVELVRQGLFKLLKIDKLVEIISNFIVKLYDKIKFPSEEK